MNQVEKLQLKTGGQWLVEPVTNKKILCRESFSEEHTDIEKLITNFAKDRILPNIYKIDQFDESLSKSLLLEMGELGLLGVDTPEEYGGSGLDKITACIIAEGVQRGGSASFGCTFGVQTAIGSLGIVFFGTSKQKEKYLPGLMKGEKIAAYALTEPSSGSDALSAKTSAVLSNDKKYYILNGEKQFISNGGWADIYTVLAQVDGNKFSGFIVERGTDGFTIGSEEKKMGVKGSSTTSLKFTDAKIPVENLLYKVGKGASIAFGALNIGRYKLAAASLGGSKIALELTINYALERRQFGQPIAKFNSVEGKIADLVVRIYSADAMLYRTVGLIQEAIDDLDKTSSEYYIQMVKTMERFSVESSMAKVYGSETSDHVVDCCLQIFGGYGFIEDYPIAMAYRDDRINRIWEGTNEINRSIITGYMMKKVLMEEVSLRDYLKDLDSFLKNKHPKFSNDIFKIEKCALETAKKLASMIFNEALCEFGQDLKHEQQLSETLANIFTNIYVSESVIYRAQYTKSNKKASKQSITIAKIYVAESLLEIKSIIPKCTNHIFKELIPERIDTILCQLEKKITLKTNTISMKSKLAEFMFTQKQYPF
jgi:alkylation response protein AidB-like acyl-CoA dehydrogenase